MASFPVLNRYANMQVNMKQVLLDGLLLVGRLTAGKVLFVSSTLGTATNDGLNPSRPMTTLALALAQCSANRGDTIYLMPGHAETISAATAISPAGVNIIGLGVGTARPTFTFDTITSAAFTVAVANVSFTNCIFVANFLSIVTCFSLTTAKEFTLTNCVFRDTSSVLNFLTIVTTGAGANLCDGLYFCDNVVSNLGVTSNNTTLNLGGTVDRLTACRNNLNWAVQNDKPGLLDITTGILTQLDCGDNHLYRPNTTTAGGSLLKVTGTTSTGWVYRNFVQTLTTTTDLLFTTTVGLSAYENRVSGVVGATGFVIPAVDS
jgi:hypothetical protein